MELKINIQGHTIGDLEMAIDEVKRLVASGNTSGFDKNDTGRYDLQVEGLAVENYAIRRNGELGEQRYPSFDEAVESVDHADARVIGLSENGLAIELT